MKPTTLFVLLCGTALVGACQPKAPEKHIVIDDWWGVDYAQDYARGACPSPAAIQGCLASAKVAVRDFEMETMTAFASDSTCAGVRIAEYEGPGQKNPPDSKRGPGNWTLMVSITDSANPKQNWTLIGTDPNYLESTDDPRSIARRVCQAINARGARVDD